MVESLEMLVTYLLFPMTQVKSMDSDPSIDRLSVSFDFFFFFIFFFIYLQT